MILCTVDDETHKLIAKYTEGHFLKLLKLRLTQFVTMVKPFPIFTSDRLALFGIFFNTVVLLTCCHDSVRCFTQYVFNFIDTYFAEMCC